MENPEYIEALAECYDDPLMVEPLTWDTAFQGWQKRARITRDLADRFADGKATASHDRGRVRAAHSILAIETKGKPADGNSLRPGRTGSS